jgi:hypothetical protein
MRRIKRAVPVILVAFAALVPSISYSADGVLDLTCEVHGEHGPDGQPMLMEWSIDLRARKACLLSDCSLKAQVERDAGNDIWLKFQSTAGGTQLFKIDRSTGEFLWHSAHDYRGMCRETPRRGDEETPHP